MKLSYRTRGNSSPQGKPRVYFTGHPSDLPAYREDIFADILQTQNCAIYYDEDEVLDGDREDLLRELEQMQLMVIPVTSRFLYQPNRARDIEFPFAMEHHIPVLPLMQEQDLEAVFNEKCGDLQMLNKEDPDPTALPYREKLEKFLASVLVGDELAEKVRAAFDAYVFLSYRKKDRRYAQELMRLIHRNDFCRDIAIWYSVRRREDCPRRGTTICKVWRYSDNLWRRQVQSRRGRNLRLSPDNWKHLTVKKPIRTRRSLIFFGFTYVRNLFFSHLAACAKMKEKRGDENELVLICLG